MMSNKRVKAEVVEQQEPGGEVCKVQCAEKLHKRVKVELVEHKQQPDGKVDKVNGAHGVEKVANVFADCMTKMFDLMEGRPLEESLKLLANAVPSDELVDCIVPENNVMRTFVETGITREQRIDQTRAVLAKSIQHYSNEDAPQILYADLAVFAMRVCRYRRPRLRSSRVLWPIYTRARGDR